MIKKVLLISAIQFILFAGFSQSSSQAQDSLLRLVERGEGEEKMSLLNQLAQSFLPANPNKCLDYAEQALDLSRKQNN